MTRRERMEARLAQREAWATKAKAVADQRFNAAHETVAGIPLGQPILVGHHSERRHRRTLERADNHMRAGVERARMAERHVSVAGSLEHALETSIFSDDPDAIEALEAKVAQLTAQRDAYKTVNAAWRKAGKPKADDVEGWTKVATLLGCALDALAKARLNQARDFMDRGPYPSYLSTNLGGNIRRCQERIKYVRLQQQRTEAAEAAGGVTVARTPLGDGAIWAVITFAEKPARATIDRLKADGFRWSGGSWHGRATAFCDELETTREGV